MAEFNVADCSVGARCPASQLEDIFLVGPYLQRGCNRFGMPVNTFDYKKLRVLGMTSTGYPTIARAEPGLSVIPTAADERSNYFRNHITSSSIIGPPLTRFFVPFATLFSAERLIDFKLPLAHRHFNLEDPHIDMDLEDTNEKKTLETLINDGITLTSLRHHALDKGLAFKDYCSTQARSTRLCESKQWCPVYNVDLGTFIAYFAQWMKFHELSRLGGYGHPFDFINEQYPRDVMAADDFLVNGVNWEAEFEVLKEFEEPFAFLTPAMQEGSALGGPFLPIEEFTLTEIHQMMNLGSIWTIGLPTMPVSLDLKDSKKACYSILAFPQHWKPEVPSESCHELPPDDRPNGMSIVVAQLPDEILSKWENKHNKIDDRNGQIAIHIGARMGSSQNPGWTVHLPAKDGLLCVMYGSHKLMVKPGSIIELMQSDQKRLEIVHRAKTLLNTNFSTNTDKCVKFGSLPTIDNVDKQDEIDWPLAEAKEAPFRARSSDRLITTTQFSASHDTPQDSSESTLLPNPSSTGSALVIVEAEPGNEHGADQSAVETSEINRSTSKRRMQHELHDTSSKKVKPALRTPLDPSLLPLRYGLKDGHDMTPDNLAEALEAVSRNTKALVSKLEKAIDACFENADSPVWTQFFAEDLQTSVEGLYTEYQTGEPTAPLQYMVDELLTGYPRRETIKSFRFISHGYRALESLLQEISEMECSKQLIGA
ncbi:hypothetical protein FSARC_2380 [Fusarium sarcochroum]|uniref:Uncharacterized protein n=1 Tax=Fusarium sarcochroum TaxID=1208366 RepID=A0A8H4U6U4_9HYPO|nr:hypothetical protein FSARC_2380 [Fusarium sarcochroum]